MSCGKKLPENFAGIPKTQLGPIKTYEDYYKYYMKEYYGIDYPTQNYQEQYSYNNNYTNGYENYLQYPEYSGTVYTNPYHEGYKSNVAALPINTSSYYYLNNAYYPYYNYNNGENIYDSMWYQSYLAKNMNLSFVL